jgi:hypothetical protein
MPFLHVEFGGVTGVGGWSRKGIVVKIWWMCQAPPKGLKGNPVSLLQKSVEGWETG